MKTFNMWDGVNQYFVSTLIHILEINKDENQKRYEIVKYVLSYIVNEIGKIMILTLIFLLQGKLFEFVIAFLTIVSLRIFIGGSHRETMLGCFLQSFLTFEAIMLLDKSIIISSYTDTSEYNPTTKDSVTAKTTAKAAMDTITAKATIYYATGSTLKTTTNSSSKKNATSCTVTSKASTIGTGYKGTGTHSASHNSKSGSVSTSVIW